MREAMGGILAKNGLGARRVIQIARAAGGGLIWPTETAESFTCIEWIIGIGCIGYSLLKDAWQGRTDNDFGCGDEGVVGAFEWLDRVRLIEMSVPPSRMLFRAFNMASNEFM